MFGYTNQQVQIQDFILVQTGTYQEQAIRPFATTIQPAHINALAEATQGGRNLTVGAIQGIANDMIRLEATVEDGVVGISQGWKSRRFRFLMRVEERHPFAPGERVQRVYFGYTDQCDASVNYLDPHMRIYFNSETVVRDFVRPTPNGNVIETMVVSANQIVAPLDMSGTHGQSLYHSRPTTFMIRPEDIFNRGSSRHVEEKMRQSGVFGGEDIAVHYDTRSMVGQNGGYKYSRRRDTTPSRYLTDTLKGYHHAIKEVALASDQDYALDREVLYEEAKSVVVNDDITKCGFFALLRDNAGFLEKGYVTLAELQQLFPETLPQHNVLKYSMDDGRSIRRVNHYTDSEHWRGSDAVTIAACTLAQVVPSIMMDNFIRSISFAATNGLGAGQFLIDIHAETLRGVVDGLQLGPYLQEFERRLIFDALAPLTHNNQVGFQISMASDLAGDSVIDIAIHGEPVKRYVAPTFTDSLFTPVITGQYQRQAEIASDLLYVLESALPFAPASHVVPAPATVPTSPYHTQASPSTPQQGTNHVYTGLL